MIANGIDVFPGREFVAQGRLGTEAEGSWSRWTATATAAMIAEAHALLEEK